MGRPVKYDQQIFAEKLKTLYRSNWISTTAHLLVGLIYLTIQLPYHGTVGLVAWYSILVSIFICRVVLTHKFFQDSRVTESSDPERQLLWMNRFRIFSLCTGLTFGSTIVFFYPSDDVPRQMFTILTLAGLAAGGLTVLVSDLVCFSGYCLSLILPIILSSFLAGSTFYNSVGFLLTIFLYINIRASRSLSKIVTTSLKLRYENLSLVASLEEEKNLLNNRLGRIFNDSSNELYIVDSVTLSCLQVNKGALENLGYTEQEIKQHTLFDIIFDLNRTEINDLLSPLHRGVKDSVTHKTLQRRKDGSTYPVELRFQLSTLETPPVLVVTALDISERDEAERKLIHQANFDQLTSLPNRYFMLSHIASALARARRENTKVALLFLDLDNFKDINDTLGHGTGDTLLKQVAARLRSLLREVDTPARLGGDEFLVMLEGLQAQEQAEFVVHKIQALFERPFMINGNEIYTTASIGISIYPDDGNSVELLMQYADTAMYSAKRDNNCRYRFFSQELRTLIDEQLAIESRLRHALKNNELSVHYQPKINILTNQVVGAEALLRWKNDELGTVPPGIFVPIAEKYGLIEEIGSWVLKTACREAVSWKDSHGNQLHVAVNISPRQFRSSNFIEVVKEALRESGLGEQFLEIEITENLLMQNASEPLEILNTLHKNNITLSLDDFGTGYSSLSYLKQFPLQVVKIDRSFIHDMMENNYNLSLVDAIISMAKILNLRLVAEGVETREQLSFLKAKNVDLVQGYLYSPALPADEFVSYLQKSLLHGPGSILLPN